MGNTRVVFRDSGGIASAVQKTNYYAFGMELEEGGNAFPYRFNGIEKVADFSLNVDFADFRTCDASIGRWWQVDPLAEATINHTPYRFGFNNPIAYIDPLGLTERKIQDLEGNWHTISDDNPDLTVLYQAPSESNMETEEPSSENSIGNYSNQNKSSIGNQGKSSIMQKTIANSCPNCPDSDKKQAAIMLANSEGGKHKTAQEWYDILDNSKDYVQERISDNVWGMIDISSLFAGGPLLKVFINYRRARIASQGAKAFFNGAKYSDKVVRQMSKVDDLYHGFPKSVDAYAAKYGKWVNKVGGDGKSYQWLTLEGEYAGNKGVFEFIKDVNGVINHRYFNVIH